MPSFIEGKLHGNGELIEIRGWLDSTRKRVRGIIKSTNEQVVYAIHNFPTIKPRQVDAIDKDNKKNNIAKKSEFRATKIKEATLDIPLIDETTGPCIYRLYYGDRFIIHRASNTLKGSIYNILKAYSYFKGHANVHKETSDKKDYYFAFYNFMRRNPSKELKVEVIFKSNDFYELLCAEHIELKNSFSAKKCLNPNLTSYIPKRMSLISPDIINRYKQHFDIS